MNNDPFSDIFGGESSYQTPEDRQQAAFNFFQSRGYQPHQAAGIVGNLMHESGMNTGAVGDKGASFGLAQWNNKRKFNLNSFARKHGAKADDFLTQLMFIDHELNGDESGAADLLRKAQDVREATRIFSEKYERPGKPMMESRLSHAGRLLGGLLGPSQAQAADFNKQDPFGDITAQPELQPTAVVSPGSQAVPTAVAPAGNLDVERQKIIDEAMNPQNMGYRGEIVRPMLEYGGAAVGGMLGTPAGPAGQVGGAALGYATGKKGADLIDYMRGEAAAPTMTESLTETAQDLPTGAMMEMGGQVAGAALPKVIEATGNVIRPILGRMSGTGKGTIEEALKGSETFTKALRGKITAEEVVENAQGALQTIKNARATAYQDKLANISNIQQELNLSPLHQKVDALMKQYGVKVGPDGKIDYSRIAMGKKGRKDIEDIIETINEWGNKPGDKTPLGLDTLKRQLDDFYSESSQARAFVTNLRNAVKNLIVKDVPEYAKMTKGYAEATKMIKDIESGLMMRKQGMTGRIVADQTLRRLVSSMKDNFELRRELVNILGAEGGRDIGEQVAGYSMSSYIPRGLAGLATITEGGLALAKFLSPKIWPFIAASSPRLQGEFLRVYGKGLKETTGASLPVGKIVGYLATQRNFAKKQERELNQYPQEFSIREGKVRRLNDRSPEGYVQFQFPDGTVRPWIPEK